MKMLITGVEQVLSGERYMDDKGWSFKKAFDRLGLNTGLFIYKKKGGLAFLEKSRKIKDVWRKVMNRSLAAEVKKTAPDILLICKGETISPETLWEIRKKTGTILVNVFPDNPLYMGRFEAIEPCHFFFVKDTYVLHCLSKAGLRNVHFLPQCTDIEVHRPHDLSDEDRRVYGADLSLIGSMYPYRLTFIRQLLDFRPALWGRGWEKARDSVISSLFRGRDIRGTAKAKAISGTHISLNPHHPLNDIYGVNRRTYDIAACRGFQISDRKQDMQRVFTEGREIICYDSAEELKKLILYYKSHPDELDEIARNAYERVIRDHTYDSRAKEILDIVAGYRP